MTPKDKTLGFFIKNARLDQKLTQEELAERADISVQYLKDIENRGANPSLKTFIKLIRTLNLSADSFIFAEHTLSDDYYKKTIRLLSQCSPDELLLFYKIAKCIVTHNEK